MSACYKLKNDKKKIVYLWCTYLFLFWGNLFLFFFFVERKKMAVKYLWERTTLCYEVVLYVIQNGWKAWWCMQVQCYLETTLHLVVTVWTDMYYLRTLRSEILAPWTCNHKNETRSIECETTSSHTSWESHFHVYLFRSKFEPRSWLASWELVEILIGPHRRLVCDYYVTKPVQSKC